jgi:hypothetical protein
MVIETVDTAFLLLWAANGTFAGVGQDGSSSTDLDQNAGTPSYFVNGVPLATLNRNAFHDVVSGAGGQVVLTITNVNMTTWTPQLAIFYYASAGFGLTGSLGEMAVMNAPTTAELNALGSYLATKWGASWTDIT